MNRMICPNYVGILCVNGSCPKANIEMYEEYGMPCVHYAKYVHTIKAVKIVVIMDVMKH